MRIIGQNKGLAKEPEIIDIVNNKQLK